MKRCGLIKWRYHPCPGCGYACLEDVCNCRRSSISVSIGNDDNSEGLSAIFGGIVGNAVLKIDGEELDGIADALGFTVALRDDGSEGVGVEAGSEGNSIVGCVIELFLNVNECCKRSDSACNWQSVFSERFSSMSDCFCFVQPAFMFFAPCHVFFDVV